MGSTDFAAHELAANENPKERELKYMLMMNTMRAGRGGPEWPKKDLQAHIIFMMALNQELHERGELVSAEGLSCPVQAKLVRAGKDGTPTTDGVFPEWKEFLAAFWIIEVESPDRVDAIGARVSALPGAGGFPLNMPVEVRLVMSGRLPEMLKQDLICNDQALG